MISKTSNEEKTATFTLKDGNLVSIEGSRSIITSIDEGCRFYVKDGENLDVTVGNDHLFALKGEMVINPDGSYLKIKGSDVRLKMGDKLIMISKGTIHIFDGRGEVIIAGEGIIVKHEDTTLFTQKGDATCYRSDNMPWHEDKEVLMHGWQIHAIVGDKSILVASFSDRYEACAGTTSNGKFRFVGGVEYELF